MPIMRLKNLPLLEVIVAALCLLNGTDAAETHVHAKKGGSAVLPCGLPAPDTVKNIDSSAPQHVIEWLRQGYDIPILIQLGVHPRVHPDYDGRVSLIGGTSLQISALLPQDEAWYECQILPLDKTTDEAGSNGSWTLLTVTSPPLLTEISPREIEAFVGRSVTLGCAALGNPRPTITWTKDGQPIKPQHKVKITNGSVSFYAVSRETSGLYQCHASNSEGNATHSTRLKVVGPPVIIIPPADTVLNVSQDAKLRCQAEADPPNMTYVWQRQGEDIYHIPSLKSRVKVIVDGTLLISRLTSEDSGNYTCMPTNGLPVPPSASAVLTVQHPAQVIQMPKMTFLPTGMKGTIHCPFRAEPPLTSVDWIKDGKLLDLGMYPGWTLTSQGAIVIATTNDDAAGVYSCTPYNSFGTMGKSEPTTVILQDPPSFKVSPDKEYRQDVGSMLVIPCQMNGNPAPKVNWKKVGPASQSLFTVAADGSLTLYPVGKDHQGEWECSSSNRVASVSTRTLVLVLGTSPHAVSSVSVIPGMNQANVSWMPGFDGGFTQRFTVWYKSVSEAWKEEKQEWLSFSDFSTENSLLVSDLQPATEYQFRVTAQNKIGTGPFSEIITITTLDARPVVDKLDPPTNLSVNTSSEGFLLWWTMPHSNQPPIDSFVLQSRLEGQEWVNLKEDIGPAESKIFLPGLCKDCKYEMRLLSQRGDLLSMPSTLISVSTIGMNMHAASSRLLDFPDRLMAGVMGGVGLICLALILTLATVCFIFQKRSRRRRQNIKDIPPAMNKNSSVDSPNDTLKQRLLPDRPHSYTSSTSNHSSLDKSSHNAYPNQPQHYLPQANPASNHSLPESHLQLSSLDRDSSVEFIHRGPDGRFYVHSDDDSNNNSCQIQRNQSQNSYQPSNGNMNFQIQKSQSLRSSRDDRSKPPFVLSVDLPPFGSDFSSSRRTQPMVKHLSLNGYYTPILEQEFLDRPDHSSLSSECSDSVLYPLSESTQGQDSMKRGNIHSTASTLVLQMEHEREQGNLSRCLKLAREREELEKELRKFSVERNSGHEITDEIYGQIWKTQDPKFGQQTMRQICVSQNTGMLKGRAASCIPWEERHKISSASLLPLQTSYGNFRQNQQGYNSIQRTNSQRSRSLDREEHRKSRTWDHRRSRTPVDSSRGYVMDEQAIYPKKAQIGYNRSQRYFDPDAYSSSDNRWMTIERGTRQIEPIDDHSEMNVDGPDFERQLPYSKSMLSSDPGYETLDSERPRLSVQSGHFSSRMQENVSRKAMSPTNIFGTIPRKTRSLGSNSCTQLKSTQSLDSKSYKEQFLTPDAWIDSLTLSPDSTTSPLASRSNLEEDLHVPSTQPQDPHHQTPETQNGFINVSQPNDNPVPENQTPTLPPGSSGWPRPYSSSLPALQSRRQNQTKVERAEEEDGREDDVEVTRYRNNSETEGSYRSYASQSSGRGSMDAPNSRQFSLSPPLTSSPETTEESDRDETMLQESERCRRHSVDENYEWDSGYVPMFLVASLSKADLQKELTGSQGKQSSTTKEESKSDLDLKPKTLLKSIFEVPRVPQYQAEQDLANTLMIEKSFTTSVAPEPDTISPNLHLTVEDETLSVTINCSFRSTQALLILHRTQLN
ncbi:hypothetical protein DNTS_017257 [Danionella cerebrum]|uniref:Uncharacterized protein n=1 Tax=Danionella cerebrum TaxID=2873325 RepID=A0A553R165_9TELE|nr:hypothetical protein DNTS_017257 [Danionella translucida]